MTAEVKSSNFRPCRLRHIVSPVDLDSTLAKSPNSALLILRETSSYANLLLLKISKSFMTEVLIAINDSHSGWFKRWSCCL